MAKFLRTTNGTAYIKLTWLELAKYSQNMHPVCDDCLKDVIGYENLILIPILNEAFCSECGKKALARIKRYPEDAEIEKRREDFYKDYFGIKEE